MSSPWRRRLASTGRPSQIIGGRGVRADIGALAHREADAGRRAYVITDEHVMDAWGSEVLALLGRIGQPEHCVAMPPGESAKNVPTAQELWEWLAAQGARRDDIVVAVGGGVVGDIAGFAASTYMRGIGLWQVPTSVVAQVDSSVGGKVAVNLPAGKNLVGCFYQADLVILDPELLCTLPAEEYVSGMGEVVKYALLSGKESLSRLEDDLEQLVRRDVAALDRTIADCVHMKADIVEADEQESGERAVLNLGHTLAHALETTVGYGTIRHGEAVAIGIVYALAVSEKTLGLADHVRARARRVLSGLGLPTSVEKSRLPSAEDLIRTSRLDKKVRASGMGFVGLADLGSPVYGIDVPGDVLAEALAAVQT